VETTTENAVNSTNNSYPDNFKVANNSRKLLGSQRRAKLYPLIKELIPNHTVQEICQILNETLWIVFSTIKEYNLEVRKRGQSPDLTFKGGSKENPKRKGYGQKNHTTRSRATYIELFGSTPSDWEVHHIDLNKVNNNPDNLVALPKSKHMSLHGFLRWGNKEGVTTILREYLQVKGSAANPERVMK
jgi:hypothetical protein